MTKLGSHSTMASPSARAYAGVWGQSPWSGGQGLRGSGEAKPLKAENIPASGCTKKKSNFSSFWEFYKLKKTQTVLGVWPQRSLTACT